MAQVTVVMPPILQGDALAQEIEAAAVAAMGGELEVIASEIKTSPQMPVNLGHLRQSIEAIPPQRRGGALVGFIVSAGVASSYAAVMDLGRTPGRRAPPLAAIKEWVKRKMRDRVRELAQELQAAYVAEHPTSYKGKSRAIGKFEARALFLLSAAISRSIGLYGTAARNFANARKPEIERRVRTRVTEEIALTMRRLGFEP